MRNTKQKNLIVDVINNSFIHPNAYQIYEECKKTIPDISLGTVYRNLNTLSDEFKIRRIKMPDNVDRFDKKVKHNHFICVHCMKVVDVCDKYLEDINSIDGNKVIDCETIFKGICEECLKKGNEK